MAKKLSIDDLDKYDDYSSPVEKIKTKTKNKTNSKKHVKEDKRKSNCDLSFIY